MIKELTDLIDNFPGPANQTWCFAHILKLVVKSIIRQFDLPDAKSSKSLDDKSKELLSLSGNVEVEEDILSRDGKGGVDRECDGFSDPRGLRSRVGTGWHITTLIKPVPVVRV